MGAWRKQRMREAATATGVALAATPLLLGAFGVAATTNPSYGAVARPDAGSTTLTLSPATGARAGAPAGGDATSPAASRGVLAVTGGPKNAAYTVAITPVGVTIGGNAATFTWHSATAASGSTGLLNNGGDDTLYLGGTSALAATSALGAGTASGAVTVTVTTVGNPVRTASVTIPASGITRRVLAPLALSRATDLDFGTIVAGATAGTLTVPADAAPVAAATGGARAIGAVAAGHFALSGEPSQAYTLAVSPSTLTLNGPSGATMSVNAFTTSPTAAATMPAGGTQTIYVGGRLNVGASQAQGTYSGILTLTVAYQ